MFRNVCFLKVASAWPDSEEVLHEALSEQRFRPCGALSETSSGWEAPADGEQPRLCRSVGGADLIQLRTQSRLLPAAAVNEAVEARLEEYRERMGDLPPRREQRRLKAETRDKLLPKALLRSERTRAMFLRSEGVIAIDAGTPVKVERFLEYLKLVLGGLEVTELPFRRPVGDLLKLIFLGDGPPGIGIGHECRMQDASDSKATVRFADMDLLDANVRRHVRDGLVLTHLGIEFDGIMSCVLDDKGRLAKLRLADVKADDTGAEEELLARFDSELILLAEVLRKFLGALRKTLGSGG